MSNSPMKNAEDQVASTLFAEAVAKRPSAPMPGTPDLESYKRQRIIETEQDNAKVLTERRHYSGG